MTTSFVEVHRLKIQHLVTAEEMRRYERNTIEKIGVPALVLMERAALQALMEVNTYLCNLQEGLQCTVLILAGVGNNGGDGLALARLLCDDKECGSTFHVEVWVVGNDEKASTEWKCQRDILRNYPVEFCTKPSRQEYTVMIDALFGMGLSREITGEYRAAVELFDKLKGWKMALDLPSGVDSDTGRILGCAPKVDYTVTFGFCKRGLMLYPGCEYAGKVSVANIGITERSFFGVDPDMFFCQEETPANLLPERKRDGNKGTFGKVLLVAGSRNMAGAAVMASKAAYRTGAGMVKVITPPENRVILQETVPEALLGTPEDLAESLEWANVIAVGPGMGKSKEALDCLEKVLRLSKKPLLVDADGLNLLAEHPQLMELLASQGLSGRSFVLTPHVGEMSRLTGTSIAKLKENLPAWGRKLAKQLHVVVVAKDARTFICGEDQPICININGNSGMATAGSGDVLTGIIVGIMAQGKEPFQATIAGVRLHGIAGDCAAALHGEHGCMAGDLAEMMERWDIPLG